ncbi:MAG: DUF4836 family protein [Flavisolibacter sp.]
MNRKLFLSAVVLSTLLFFSCKNEGTKGLPIPKDASLIVHIDGSSLASKLSWKDIQQTQWFQDMSKKEQDSTTQKLLSDPEASGVDAKSDFVFFMKQQGTGSYFVFEGKLKDAKDFEAMITKLHEGKDIKIQKDGDLSYVQQAGEGHMLAWNSSKFIFIGGAPGNPMAQHFPHMNNGDTTEIVTQSQTNPDSLRTYVKNLLTLSKDNSMESNDRFKDLVTEKGDVHFWMNMEQYYSQMETAVSQNPFFSMMAKMNDMMKGNIATGTLSFDDGKITIKTKQYMSEQMKKIWDKYPTKNVSEDLVNRIPSQNVTGVFVMNYPPEAMKELLRGMGMDGLINSFLGKVNFSLDELVQAMKGQVVVAATDFTVTSVPHTVDIANGQKYTFNSPSPDVKFLLAMSVNNKASFDKLISVAESQLKDSSEKKALMSKINYQTNNDWFALSNSSQVVSGFLGGQKNNLPFASRISGHPFGAYINIQKLIQGFKGMTSEGNSGLFDASMNVWQDIVITGGDYKNGVSTGESTINFIDKNTNSLKQINQYIEKMYESKKNSEANMMNPTVDSTVTAQPVPGK